LRVVRVFGVGDFDQAVVAGAPAPVELYDIADYFGRESDALFESESARDGKARAVEIHKHRVGVGVDDGDGGEVIASDPVGASAHRINARLFQIGAQQSRRGDASLSGARRRNAHQRNRRDDGDDGHHDHHLKKREAALAAPPALHRSHLFSRQLVHRCLHKKALFH